MWPVTKMFRALFGGLPVQAPLTHRYRCTVNGRTYEAATLEECLRVHYNAVGFNEPWALAGQSTKEANARARETLLSFLNEEQRKTFEEEHFFEVIGSQGNRYRIMTNLGNASGNVTWRAPGSEFLQNLLPDAHFTVGGIYCAYPRKTDWNGKAIPVLDQILGQMLELVTDENAYLAKANLFGGTYPPTYTGRESWRPPAPFVEYQQAHQRALRQVQVVQDAIVRDVQGQQVAWGVERYDFRYGL